MRTPPGQLLALVLPLGIMAQPTEKTISTDSGRVELHYFTFGEISTKAWMDKDDRWGHSWAYKRSGEVIFDGQTRKVGGHASIRFWYYPSGAVSKVETSDAPDGGIQWYESTTTFDEDGQRTGFQESGQDDNGPITRPTVTRIPPAVVQPVVPETVYEQRLFVNELFVVNPTKWTCAVDIIVDDPSPALRGGHTTIGPRDTLRIGSYSIGERFSPPDEHVRVFLSRKKGKSRWYRLANYRLHEVQVNPEHRRYYRVVDGWITTKRIW